MFDVLLKKHKQIVNIWISDKQSQYLILLRSNQDS